MHERKIESSRNKSHIVNNCATLRFSLPNQQLGFTFIFFCTSSHVDKFTDDIYLVDRWILSYARLCVVAGIYKISNAPSYLSRIDTAIPQKRNKKKRRRRRYQPTYNAHYFTSHNIYALVVILNLIRDGDHSLTTRHPYCILAVVLVDKIYAWEFKQLPVSLLKEEQMEFLKTEIFIEVVHSKIDVYLFILHTWNNANH